MKPEIIMKQKMGMPEPDPDNPRVMSCGGFGKKPRRDDNMSKEKKNYFSLIPKLGFVTLQCIMFVISYGLGYSMPWWATWFPTIIVCIIIAIIILVLIGTFVWALVAD